MVDVCIRLRNASNGQTWFYFLFAITAKFHCFDSLIFLAIRAGCSTAHCQKEAQEPLQGFRHLTSPTQPPLSHVHTYSHIYSKGTAAGRKWTESCSCKKMLYLFLLHLLDTKVPCHSSVHVFASSFLENKDEWRRADGADEEKSGKAS